MCCKKTFAWISRYKKILTPCQKFITTSICTGWLKDEMITFHSAIELVRGLYNQQQKLLIILKQQLNLNLRLYLINVTIIFKTEVQFTY